MEAQVEAMIEQYLTRCGKVFTSSQYEIPFDKAGGMGGACPDVVALDFSRSPKEIVVVEITVSSSTAKLMSKIRERETRWYRPLLVSLQSSGVVDANWTIRFLGFLRAPNVERARAAFLADTDVWFYAIEDAVFSYKYWKDRMANGIPRPPPTLG